MSEVRFAASATSPARSRCRAAARHRDRRVLPPGRRPREPVRRAPRLPSAAGPGGWRLAAERRGRERQPWELSPVREVSTEHVLLLTPRAVGVDGIPAVFERAYRTVPGGCRCGRARATSWWWPATPRRPAPTPRISGLESLVAIADADVRQAPGSERPLAVISQRLVLIWPGYRAQDAAGRERVLEHELTHLVTPASPPGSRPAGWRRASRSTSRATGGWPGGAAAGHHVAGGAYGPAADAAHRVLSLTALSAPDALARLAGPAQGAAYAYASSAAFYIAARYGRTRSCGSTGSSTPTTCPARRARRSPTRRSAGARAVAGRPRAQPAALDPDPRGALPAESLTPCPSFPRSRRSAARWRPAWRAGAWAPGDPRRALVCAASIPAVLEARRAGPARGGARPPGQVPRLAPGGRRPPASCTCA